jgi:hypothetical protein
LTLFMYCVVLFRLVCYVFLAGFMSDSCTTKFMDLRNDMCVCMYVCMYVGMHACMYVCIHACMYAYMHVCMYAHKMHLFRLRHEYFVSSISTLPKGILRSQQRAISGIWGFHSRDFPDTINPYVHALRTVLCLRAINYERHFTWRTK